MTRVEQIAGSPGTGKTYTLRQRLENAASSGTNWDEFYWITFTRAGRSDVQGELPGVYPEADQSDVKDRARTLHSLALSLVMREGLIDWQFDGPDPIISAGGNNLSPDPYEKFADKHGMRYDPRAADPRSLLRNDTDTASTPPANKFFAINDYLTQTCKPPDKVRQAPVSMDADETAVAELLKCWDVFKREWYDQRLYEHGDYVALAYEHGVAPDVDLLLVDEFQDFAPLEYRLYKQWRDAGGIRKIVLAGDPNQSIYSFRGGTPYYFNNTDVDAHELLTDSFRCPTAVADAASDVLAGHAETPGRPLNGREEGGTVRWRTVPNRTRLRSEIVDAADRVGDTDGPSVMLLARTNGHLRQITRDLRSVGVPFEVLGTAGSVWRDDLNQLLAALGSYAAGSGFSSKTFRTLLKYLPDGGDRRAQLGDQLGQFIPRESAANALHGFDTASSILSSLELSEWKADVLRAAVESDHDLAPSDVSVGTIHTAKGLESPAVFLFAASTERLQTEYNRDDDHAAEEHRTYYVGASRASKELHVVDGYMDAPTPVPLDTVRPRREIK